MATLLHPMIAAAANGSRRTASAVKAMLVGVAGRTSPLSYSCLSRAIADVVILECRPLHVWRAAFCQE